MEIRTKYDTGALAGVVEHWLSKSRFTASVETGKGRVKLRTIRLKIAKPYCGNHAFLCPFDGRRKRRATFLEGADWVDFNDQLNDLLDSLEIDAIVASSVCTIREGRNRRVSYDADFQTRAWYKIGPTADYCGKRAPASNFPASQGLYTRGE